MKRNLLLLILALALAVGCLASCQQDCEHTFSENWNSDETSHWHPATCEHGEVKDSLASHVDADEDGICEVCEYEVGHTHTLEDEWSNDETHHWKNATCSHSDYKGESSLHSDENSDGHCDVCAVHVHGVNAAGFCTYTECGKQVVEIDESDLAILVYAISAQQRFANGGSMDYIFDGRSNNATGGFATRSDRKVTYLFGNNGYTYNKTETVTTGETETTSKLESWTMPDGAENTFGVYSENDGALQLDISDSNKLLGFYLALSSLADGYGPDEILISLYEISQGSMEEDTDVTITDLEIISYPEENNVSFSYTAFILQVTEIAVGDDVGSLVYNANHFDVEVSFTYTENYVLTSLDVLVDCYTNDPGALPSGALNEADVDFDYDPDTETYTFRDTALADTYDVSIEQTVGERTEENPNPKSKFIPESFDLYLEMDDLSGALSGKFNGDTISVNVRDVINLYVGDCTPAGTSIHFVSELITMKLFKDGVEVADIENYLNETAVAMFTFAGEQRSFFIIPKQDGAYRFEIYLSGEKLHEVNIFVGVVDEEFIELEDNEFAVKVTETYEWSNEVSFTAKEAGTYYFNLPAGIGFIDADGFDAAEKTPATDDTPNPYYDYFANANPDGSYREGSFSLTLEAGETVRFYVNGAKRGTYVISYFVF